MSSKSKLGFNAASLYKIVYSEKFEMVIGSVIATNAIVLALLTMPDNSPGTVEALRMVDEICFAIYVFELGLRIASYGKRPWDFFKTGWNVFDFLIVGLSPFAQGQTVVLRLLRLLRLIRIFRFLPEVRILSLSIVRSIPPLLSISVLIGLLLFLYGMAGTYLFGDELREDWGDIVSSLKTLFVMLTLENFADTFEEGLLVSPLALPFFLSYLFVIVFTVLNILIGIVLNAMDEARKENRSDLESAKVEELKSQISSLENNGVLNLQQLDELEKRIASLKNKIDS